MDDIVKPGCEFFTVSVDSVLGMTYINGTDLGKQFLLGNLCKMTETNIFTAFLNFCRRKTKVIKVHMASTRKIASVPTSKKTLKAVYPIKMTYRKRKEALGTEFVGKPGNSRKKQDDNLPAQIQPSEVQSTLMSYESEDLPESKIPEESGTGETPESKIPEESGAGEMLVGTHSSECVDEPNILHTGVFKEADTSMEEDSAETEESKWETNNTAVNTFSLQNKINTPLQADENSHHSNDVFPVVKQEPDWELDTSENFNQHASTQTPTEARDSGIDDCGQMDTETSAEKFLSASSDWQVKSVGEEQIGRDNEENNDIVIKSEPVWDDENEEFYNVMNGVSVGKRNNNSTTVDNVPKFSIEESSCGDLPENEEYIEDPYSVPKHEEEWSEGIDNAEDPSIGEDTEVRRQCVYNFGDHMYFMQRPCLTEENTSERLAVKKLEQAREEAEAKRNVRQLALGNMADIKAESDEKQVDPSPPRPMIRHPKTGKFCTLGRLKRIEKLHKNLEKHKNQENLEECKVDSITKNPLADQQKLEKQNEIRTVYFAIKIRSEWKCHCGQSFMSQSDFSEHDKEFHNARLRLCEYCGEFLKVRSYKYHVRSHFPERRPQYQCNRCDKKYSNAAGLKKHVDFFHGGKRLICDACGKKFQSPTSFQRHQYIHKKILNYLCNFCDKKFVTKYALQTHKRVHTGEKPFSCEYCGLKFNHNVSRKTHIRKDHPGREIHTTVRT